MDILAPNRTDVNTPPALEVLKPGSQWVCFDEKKIPLCPTTRHDDQGDILTYGKDNNPIEAGKAASVNEPLTWDTCSKARATSKAYSLQGVGRVFLKEQGITGVDLDHCIDEHGAISPYAQDIVTLLDSYTEYSPSGTGLHIWVHGSISANIPADANLDGDNRLEMYDCKRFFTVTGKHLPGTPTTIEDRQEQLTALHEQKQAQRQEAKARQKPPRVVTPPKKITQASGDTPYGLKALGEECAIMASTGDGSRNNQLNTSAYSLGQLVAGHEITRSTVERELSGAAARAGLDDREIDRTLRSGIEDGMQSPRSAPPAPTPQTATSGSNGHIPPAPGATTAFDLCRFDADDSGNGDAMYALYGRDFLYCGARGWFSYAGTHWQLDPDCSEVKRKAVETLRARRHAAVDAEKEAIIKCTVANENRVNGCISRFKTLVSVSIDTFDCDPDVLNCQNGVLDLRTGELEQHSHEQRFTYCVPVDFVESDCSEWLDYLNGVVGGGQEVIDYLQMAAGYSLTGHTREEMLIYLHGPTRSGKGTFAETFMRLLPIPLSTMVDFNSFTAKREGDVSNFDLAPLKPSRMIFASESNRSQTLNPAKIKQLTGGDQIRACFKHKDFFAYRPQFKVWMISNHPVNGDPEDDALWGRVRVIEFPHSFLGIEDKSKKARLKESDALQGVLWWAVEGAIKWYGLGAKGLTTPETIARTTQSQRDDLDYVQQWLGEATEDQEDTWTANDEVMASYIAWCKNNSVQYPKGPKTLAQSLKAKGYEVSKPKRIKDIVKKGVCGLYVYPIEKKESVTDCNV